MQLTGTRLAQSLRHQTAVWEVLGSDPSQKSNQVLETTSKIILAVHGKLFLSSDDCIVGQRRLGHWPCLLHLAQHFSQRVEDKVPGVCHLALFLERLHLSVVT